MSAALWLLLAQGALGAFDTLYYHEWRARLPAGAAQSRPELLLHAARDGVYALLFATLGWLAWRGAWAGVLLALVAAEIVITLADFAIEDRVRVPLGGVYPGERATHTLMAIVYGAFLACFLPVVWADLRLATGFSPRPAPAFQAWALTLMGGGVLFSGLRDLYAALGGALGRWPWPPWAVGKDVRG
jgi:hypothetical protein